MGLRKYLLLVAILSGCNAPKETAAVPTYPITYTSNAVPAGVVRVHQFYNNTSATPTCEQYPDSNGNTVSHCGDDFIYQCGAVKDFPESEVAAIKTFYAGCTLTHEYIEQDHTELMYDCTNNCTFVNIACTCTAGNKRRYTCVNPSTLAQLAPGGCEMFYP